MSLGEGDGRYRTHLEAVGFSTKVMHTQLHIHSQSFDRGTAPSRANNDNKRYGYTDIMWRAQSRAVFDWSTRSSSKKAVIGPRGGQPNWTKARLLAILDIELECMQFFSWCPQRVLPQGHQKI